MTYRCETCGKQIPKTDYEMSGGYCSEYCMYHIDVMLAYGGIKGDETYVSIRQTKSE